mmetsp:Transcript_3389/g.13805  ORF Transcript_3389/g.13805 Transcript_3389/m.13805 type:complete len:266 (-) Transcript_3389:1023-1820(-)
MRYSFGESGVGFYMMTSTHDTIYRTLQYYTRMIIVQSPTSYRSTSPSAATGTGSRIASSLADASSGSSASASHGVTPQSSRISSYSLHSSGAARALVRTARIMVFLGVCSPPIHSTTSTLCPSSRMTCARNASVRTSPSLSRRMPCRSVGASEEGACDRVPLASRTRVWRSWWQHGATSVRGAFHRTARTSASSVAVSHACSASTTSTSGSDVDFPGDWSPPGGDRSPSLGVGNARSAPAMVPSTNTQSLSHPSADATRRFVSRA